MVVIRTEVTNSLFPLLPPSADSTMSTFPLNKPQCVKTTSKDKESDKEKAGEELLNKELRNLNSHQLYSGMGDFTCASFIFVSFLTTLHANCCCVTLCMASSTSPEAP
jgi:hypothetical protein